MADRMETMAHVSDARPLTGRAVQPRNFGLRFAVGDVRLATVKIPVNEISGHFLVNPIHVADVIAIHTRTSSRRSTLARSVLLGDDEAPKGVHILIEYPHHYVDLRGDFKTYLAHFSSKTRATLLRKIRKFEGASRGAPDISTFRTRADVEGFLTAARPLSRQTYQHRLFKSGLPDTSAFQRYLENLAEDDLFRGWTLRLEGKTIAYICTTAIGRALQYDYVGFDASVATLSPGTVLQFFVLEQLFDEQTFEYFDFGEGTGDHKALFGTHQCRCADVLIPATTKASLLLAVHHGFHTAADLLATAADRTGLKPRLRRLLRR